MQFKAGDRKPKATLEIDGVEYKIMKPTLDQADRFSEAYESAKGSGKEISKLMREYVCDLGSIPIDKIGMLENELFLELFTYITNPEKKT